MAAKVLSSRGILFERAEAESPQLVSRLIQQCELAKCQLSSAPQASVRIPDRAGSIPPEAETFTIDREQLDQWTQHILARVELPIRRALGDARLKPADLSDVILVGGATRMPMFVDRVRHLLGREPHCSLNPDEVVALGAAVQAGLISSDTSVADLVVTDVSPFTLGVEVSKRLGAHNRHGYFMPIIHRNTTIPVSRVERVSTAEPNQTKVNVRVYQGESRRTEDNLLLGEFEVRNVPLGPPGQEIDLRFTYDLNGVLEVEATIVKTGQIVTHVISRHARQLSNREVADAVAAMQALKVHPREETPNRFALRKAERVYQELPAAEREYLGSLLDGFEAALEGGDKSVIEEHRLALEEFLNHFERGFDAPESDHE
jgi:molecular chaperone HscC